MHRSFDSMQGMPVTSEQGLRLGAVQDAYMDPLEQRIVALLLDWENDSVRGPEDILPISQISELNADVLTVAYEIGVSSGLEYEFQIQTEGLLLVNESLIGRELVFASGERLGSLADVQFDPRDGSIAFYELGNADNSGEDRPNMMIPTHPDIEFRDHQIVLPDKLKAVAERAAQPGAVTFVDAETRDAEGELVGEDDIEVFRNPQINPF